MKALRAATASRENLEHMKPAINYYEGYNSGSAYAMPPAMPEARDPEAFATI